MAVKVAINGFGRIGRLFFRASFNHPDMEIVAINDLTDAKTLAHLLKYDSVHGKYDKNITYTDKAIIIDGKSIRIFSEKDPAGLPWKDLGVEYIAECTGIFRTKEKAQPHIDAGASKVVLSAPAKGEGVATFVMGVNEEKYNKDTDHIVSNASCTTNCLAPVVKIINDNFRVKRGLMTTIHSYTNDQKILDLPHSDLRRARAAAMSMIPTTTGAAKAVGLVIPEVAGKLDGIAVRVPTPNVSLVDVVLETEKSTTKDELNGLFKEAANGKMKDILGFAEEPLVSTDYIGDARSSIVDADNTAVSDGNFIKVLSWYDNENGYSCRMRDLILYMASK
ncbi:MAG: type I glyceraldehyde-3-phosphate dehydrogenase [Candidatus Muiribacteriaceae bacterium]